MSWLAVSTALWVATYYGQGESIKYTIHYTDTPPGQTQLGYVVAEVKGATPCLVPIKVAYIDNEDENLWVGTKAIGKPPMPECSDVGGRKSTQYKFHMREGNIEVYVKDELVHKARINN